MTECLYKRVFSHRSAGTGLFNSNLISYRTSAFQLLNSVGLNLHLCFFYKREDATEEMLSQLN